MAKIVAGNLDGKGLRIGIVVSRFNELINQRLLEGATDVLIRHGVKDGDITVVYVPGSFEIPFAAKKLAQGKTCDAILCLGTVIRGETSHYQFIASEVTKGVASCSMESGVPIAFGVITCETLEQAIERAGTKSGNRGRDAALTAIEMANLVKALG